MMIMLYDFNKSNVTSSFDIKKKITGQTSNNGKKTLNNGTIKLSK